ncbi:MAG: PQQ-dependent sugar dehydrogenase [Dehalococcoidia bacterium]
MSRRPQLLLAALFAGLLVVGRPMSRSVASANASVKSAIGTQLSMGDRGSSLNTLPSISNPTKTARGDVNNDGMTNALDALCILREVATLRSTANCPGFSMTAPSPGDINNDGTVNAVDALCILRGVAGLAATGGCPWFTTFTLGLQQVASGLTQPVFLTGAGDGSGRLFVVGRTGIIQIIANGSTLATPFLDIQTIVNSNGGEQGLLGLAFHPDFQNNHRLFVAYTAHSPTGDGDVTIAEYHVSSTDKNQADSSNGRVLIAIPHFSNNHNGGMIAFGGDGYLYAGTGDGGGEGDPRGNGQNPNSLLGKILRIDVNSASQGKPYGIPSSNPFADGQRGQPEIWAYGLRNPWRFSFDRTKGDLYIGDVGQDAWEEVDFQSNGDPGGENYGWNTMEGDHCYSPASGCNRSGVTLPVWEYGHDPECAIIGGYVYRGAAFPAMAGAYFYADFCSGGFWALYQSSDRQWHSVQLLQAEIMPVSFGQDDQAELYIIDGATGTIYRLTAAAG